MKVLLLLFIAALITGTAIARPLLVPPIRLALPDPGPPQVAGELDPHFSGVAIDGNTLLVVANRAINPRNDRVDGVYLFERSAAGTWNYVRPIIEQPAGEFRWSAGVLVNGNVATITREGGFAIYERGVAGWSQTGFITGSGYPFRIDDNAVYARRELWYSPSCVPPYEQLRKVAGSWQVAATIGGERCGYNLPDVNDGRLIQILQPSNSGDPREPARLFADTGGAAWSVVANIPPPPANPPYVNWFGPSASLSGDTLYIRDGYVYRDTGGNNWVQQPRFREPEHEAFYNPGRELVLMRGDSLFLMNGEADYEHMGFQDPYSNYWNTLRVYRKRGDGTFDYFARLNPDFNMIAASVSEDGRRVAAISDRDNFEFEPYANLSVFEIPATANIPATQTDNFASGNYARWTPNAGEFAIASIPLPDGSTRVLRQSSLAGDSGAEFTAADWTDQAIEADIRPLQFAGTGRWFGLTTRRTDAQNHYYVTFRAPSTVSLRRMRNGTYTTLAERWLPEPLVAGRSYRVRLESVGDQHAVFLEGKPVLHAKDSAHRRGRPGVAGYRTRYELDNVIVSGGTRYLMRNDGFPFGWSQTYNDATGTWEPIGVDDDGDGWNDGAFIRQSGTTGDARWFSNFAIGDQVVSARVRPMSYGTTTGTQDPWVGVAACVVDERNYLYVTLRRSNRLSLRKLVNGSIVVLADVPVTVTTGAWHDLRLEVIGTAIRAYVNGDMKIDTRDTTVSPTGRSALLMYKTAADTETYVAYQP